MARLNAVIETTTGISISTFHSTLTTELIKQMKAYLDRSNRLPMQTLGWQSPIDIRKALLGANF